MEQYAWWGVVVLVAGSLSGVIGFAISKIDTSSKWYKPLKIVWDLLQFLGTSEFANEGTKQGFEAKLPLTSGKRDGKVER